MKSIMKRIEIFCYKHPRFGINNLMTYLVIGNIIVFLFEMMNTSRFSLAYLLYFNPQLVLQGQIWRIVTFVLVPSNMSNILYLVLELYFYYFIGSSLEAQWGSGKFTIYYLSGMLLNIIFGVLAGALTGMSFFVSAQYLNLSMFFAFATLYPDLQVRLFFFIPIKVKWLALVDALFFVWGIVTTSFPANLLPVVAILNYLVFCGGWLFDFVRPSRMQQRANTVNYKREAKKVRRDQAKQAYTRKCTVCGKTDTDYPDMEFRYCSRCEGYHCYCQDHINNHVHMQ